MIEELDPLFKEAARFVISFQTITSSKIQQRFKVGYNKADKLIQQLVAKGILNNCDRLNRYTPKVNNDHDLDMLLYHISVSEESDPPQAK